MTAPEAIALAVAMTNMTTHTGASRTQVAELVRLAREAGPDTAVVDERIAAALALHPATVRGKGTMASTRYCPECGMPIPCATRTALTGGTP